MGRKISFFGLGYVKEQEAKILEHLEKLTDRFVDLRGETITEEQKRKLFKKLEELWKKYEEFKEKK